jgi:hypothetical protein
MSTVQLPTHLVSEIIGLTNTSYSKVPIVVQINPETGKQMAYDRNDSLNLFKWANRSEKNRKRWLSVVSGKQALERSGNSQFDDLLE